MATLTTAGAEEAPITAGATVSPFEVEPSGSWTLDSLSDGCYKSRMRGDSTDLHSGMKEFVLKLPSS